MAETRRLPPPHTEAWDWQRHAACRGVSSDLFFGPPREPAPARQRREQQATALCAECPVQVPCRAYALRVGEPYGVWGGLTPADRTELQHRPAR